MISFFRPTRDFPARYGPWALVTGASEGIGREVAHQLAATGLHLVLVARRASELTSLAETLQSRHAIEVRTVPLDLGESASASLLEEATADLDVGLLVAAAGFGTSGRFLEGSLEEELEMLSLNCRAVLLQSHHFGRRFARRGSGGMILFGSIVGFQGAPYAAHYSATKAYNQALAEALHVELAGSGVDVLSSAPGPTRSGFAERAGMTMTKALDPALVARETLAALGVRSTVSPGRLTKFLTFSLGLLPRRARVQIMSGVMQGTARRPVETATPAPDSGPLR